MLLLFSDSFISSGGERIGCQPTLIPHLVVNGASDAIAFYERALGATEIFHMPADSGKLMHATIAIGDAQVFLCDEFSGSPVKSPLTLGGNSFRLRLNVPDTDAAYERAVRAIGVMPPADMPWGSRYAIVNDPFGHTWSLATHIEDVSPEEFKARMKAGQAAQAAQS